MEYYVVDAFTEQPGGGNAAGVVLLGEGRFPDAQIMQEIAAELRFPRPHLCNKTLLASFLRDISLLLARLTFADTPPLQLSV